MQRLAKDDSKKLKGEALANDLESANNSVRTAYGQCPSYDMLIPALLEHGVENLSEHVHFAPGIPIKAMLARPTNGVTEVLDKFSGCEFTCEYKYDGERAQVWLTHQSSLQLTCAPAAAGKYCIRMTCFLLKGLVCHAVSGAMTPADAG